MFLIMSAQYIGKELQSEFGKLPPSFLPLGNRRLFQHQLKLNSGDRDIYLSIPESYEISEFDLFWLNKNGVKIIYTPDDLQLGESLIAAINLSENKLDKSLSLLFGDTLFNEAPCDEDVISISNSKDEYDWTIAKNILSYNEAEKLYCQGRSDGAVNGFFNFSNPRQLLFALTKSKGDFFNGLRIYQESTKLNTYLANDWMDFGHVNTYYRSKSKFTTQRAFNNLIITKDYIEKSSDKTAKIKSEAKWFCEIPYNLKKYIPQYLGENINGNNFSYRLEYLYNTSLSELYVFSDVSENSWKNIINLCVNFLKECRLEVCKQKELNVNDLSSLFFEKTNSRLKEFCEYRGIRWDETWNYKGELVSILDVLEMSEKYLPSIDWPMSVMHGDFCFSNILYDTRSQKIKVIDPRGIDANGASTIYGDVRYDIAKLSHSIIGLYDLILAGHYDVSIENNKIELNIYEQSKNKTVQEYFIHLVKKEFGISLEQLKAMQIQLFLSMLPLHSDDKNRQNALFANAFRLYFEIIRGDK
ncbi:capsular biosynthesis protein [Photobacterium damselae subsp. damselae]|uniref:capsular biosynthesis protein n=1 Tax=Photobacterium damselae TaxID=38293 RepID=UPI001F36EA95|nr:capsular biosynthesis protein [Photobacterium damselae]UKA06987.1 capsular biosynthesis protein [Photobacterium damselae subsp. damselae]UKA22092.1 capsular biosynthesis protein [Photobacterium damselae subsp. damselae]